MSKQCTKCKQVKPFSEFGTSNGTKKDGYNSWCLQCCRDVSKRHRNTPSGIYSNIKGKQKWLAKRHNDPRTKPFDISRKDFVSWHNSQPKICGYCDIPEDKIPLFAKKYGGRDGRLTIDCMDNDAGYVKGNLILACDTCNFIKSNVLSYEEMRVVGESFIKPKWVELIYGVTVK